MEELKGQDDLSNNAPSAETWATLNNDFPELQKNIDAARRYIQTLARMGILDTGN